MARRTAVIMRDQEAPQACADVKWRPNRWASVGGGGGEVG